MLPPGLASARQVKLHYDQVYEELIASGQYQPFLYPWATIGFGVVLAYLLVDHRKSAALQALRLPIFGSLCAFSTWCVLYTRARSAPAAYGVGLITGWGTLWTASLMFFNDCQTDFQRIERADDKAIRRLKEATDGCVSNGKMPRSEQRRRSLHDAEHVSTLGPSQRQGPLIWQSYPARPFIERLDWVVDVFCNFRGIGWNFQIYGIPAPPSDIDAAFFNSNSVKPQTILNELTISKTGIRRYGSRPALLKYTTIRLVLGFIALDILKVLMHHDPYFWGYTSAPAPTYLPNLIRSSPIITKSYRLLLSLAGIYTALQEVFRLGPIFFSGILGPNFIGLRGTPWMNPPDFFGSFTHGVLDRGLAGWWSIWWHQIFRYAFEAPATQLLQLLNIPKRSQRGKAVGLLVAFTLSGSLHACGSYTQLGSTNPIRGPFLFFLLQAVGILAQTFLAQPLKGLNIPKPLRQLTNFIVVHVWLYHTAPLLADDFAKGGVWLYEPSPISPLRVLGFGAKDDRGWDLWYGLVFWHRGRSWWDTGLAF